MHRLTIEYGTPDEVEAFDRHYVETHVPLAQRIPGLRRLTRSHALPMRGNAPHLVVELWFDDEPAMRAALGSAEMAAAADDARAMNVASVMYTGDVIEWTGEASAQT